MVFHFFTGISLTGNGDSLASDGEVYTSTLTSHAFTRAVGLVRVAQVVQAHIGVFFVCVVSKAFIILHACHVSQVAWPATDFTFTEHSYLIFSVVPFTLACHFHSANWTLVWPICRTVSAHTRSALVTNRGFASVAGSDSKLWMSWRSQEPVLSITKRRSFTCSFPRPRTYRKRASHCALLNKSLLYQRHGFGRKLWNCGSHAVHSTESRPWTCPLPAACGGCWGDQGMRWNLKECNEMVRILSTEFQASGWASFCCASPEPRFWKRWCFFFAALSQ